MPKWRLVLSKPNSGRANMAIDHALWESFQLSGQPFLRFYQWNPATLSLGRFQHLEEGCCSLICASLERVRRITGGGAIWHDRELTYSLACCQEDLSLVGVKASFEKLTAFLLEAWKACGWSAFYAKDVCQTPDLGKTTIACFAGKQEYDIVVNGKKLGGNAQARTRSKIFQHGSIPLEVDFDFLKKIFLDGFNPCPKEVTSLKELGWSLGLNELQKLLVKSFSQTMQIEFFQEELNLKEYERAQELEHSRYENPALCSKGRLLPDD